MSHPRAAGESAAPTFESITSLPVSADEAWNWHARPGAFERLSPPWRNLEILERPERLENGCRLIFRIRQGPASIRWVALHEDVEPGRGFTDVQEKGPFARWRHRHGFEPEGDGSTCRLVDRIHYALPGGILGRAVFGGRIRDDLSALFAHRNRVLLQDLAMHRRYASDRPLRIAIAGASGLIGTTLGAQLETGGHEVIRVVRRQPGAGEVGWTSEGRWIEGQRLENLDAFVDLAGAGIADGRWSPSRKRLLRSSRVDRVRAVVAALGTLDTPPKVFLCASGVGIYGDTGHETVTESSPLSSEGFLAPLARDWEAAAAEASELGARVVHLRFGVVMSPRGGALARMAPPYLAGVGAVPGDGRQLLSWITADDTAGAIVHGIFTPELEGPVNVTSPRAAPLGDVGKALGKALRRPHWGTLPAAGLRMALGQMAEETVLQSTAAAPTRLLETGYEFRNTELVECFRELYGRAVGPAPEVA
ncbi:MAG: TIGR01777 family oxidoreductase [Acidobacteriota bacterium]